MEISIEVNGVKYKTTLDEKYKDSAEFTRMMHKRLKILLDHKIFSLAGVVTKNVIIRYKGIGIVTIIINELESGSSYMRNLNSQNQIDEVITTEILRRVGSHSL